MATRERGKGAQHLTSTQAGLKRREGHCFGSNWKSLSVNKFHLFLGWKTFVTLAWQTSNRSSSWRNFWLTRVARVVQYLTNDCGETGQVQVVVPNQLLRPTGHLIRGVCGMWRVQSSLANAHKCDSCACVCVCVCVVQSDTYVCKTVTPRKCHNLIIMI